MKNYMTGCYSLRAGSCFHSRAFFNFGQVSAKYWPGPPYQATTPPSLMLPLLPPSPPSRRIPHHPWQRISIPSSLLPPPPAFAAGQCAAALPLPILPSLLPPQARCTAAPLLPTPLQRHPRPPRFPHSRLAPHACLSRPRASLAPHAGLEDVRLEEAVKESASPPCSSARCISPAPSTRFGERRTGGGCEGGWEGVGVARDARPLSPKLLVTRKPDDSLLQQLEELPTPAPICTVCLQSV